MGTQASTLPVGLAGLRYGVSQVSLAVRDLDRTMARYHRAFGWAPWQVFDHVLPIHHATELRGKPVNYALRGAEVYVGALNFELLQPLEGPNLWGEFIDRRGEGIASIATMFLERADGDAVKAAFHEQFGIEVSMKADIGDHIEYFYLDTEARFGCLIESGSGHAIDFVKAASVYPHDGAKPGPSPVSGITYPITGVAIVVRDLPAKLRSYHDAFGWGPWKVYDAAGDGVLRDASWRGQPADFRLRWAETMVGDLNVELLEPLAPGNPFHEFLETKGEGIASVAVMFGDSEETDRVKEQFAADEIGVAASATIGMREWFWLDTEHDFTCLIKSGTGHAFDSDVPHTVFP